MERKVTLAYGDGGELAHKLIQQVFVSAFGNQDASRFDSALLSLGSGNIAVTTDSFVVNPLFFPGGSIGKIAVAGTINDLSVAGTVPLYLTAGFIIEEGFPLGDLRTIVRSLAEEAAAAGVRVVAGDTKVVEKGGADGLYINTTGIGLQRTEHAIRPEEIQEGDDVIISGTLGDHGIAILAARGELGLMTDLKSDCAPLNRMIDKVLESGAHVRIMRDPTRGGVATTLVEIAEDFGTAIEISEAALPIRDEVRGACDILGFDPLYLANEGKVILIVAHEDRQKTLDALRAFPEGSNAKVIGHVIGKEAGRLLLETPLGSKRRLHRLSGMMLPRIC
ncbi:MULTISPECIES: hydrogenase expression/formation protein HypE [unclassified Sporolactobacillus]|uniref:hydrogenase expression/formation protein HypE n=1 Tax=unclassified Sporolactobacillus TaxID=2628533 RepID=UPI002367B6C3|nr:hydrogenase expression/formation protein HypE [Sporolactobacillus sp. CQH2019]MDD9148115.1 hydrogenase expression/formation protein HypE [Sporolactobacillus sp. CQH2019]